MAVTPAPDTLGPHAIGAEQGLTVSSDTPFAQVADAMLQKLSRVQNLGKD